MCATATGSSFSVIKASLPIIREISSAYQHGMGAPAYAPLTRDKIRIMIYDRNFEVKNHLVVATRSGATFIRHFGKKLLRVAVTPEPDSIEFNGPRKGRGRKSNAKSRRMYSYQSGPRSAKNQGGASSTRVDFCRIHKTEECKEQVLPPALDHSGIGHCQSAWGPSLNDICTWRGRSTQNQVIQWRFYELYERGGGSQKIMDVI